MSIYYRTNEFGEELCPTCGKKLFHVNICTYPPIPRYECTNCGYIAEGDKVIDSGTSTVSLTPHSYCTRFETNVNEKGIVQRCVECNKEYFTPWFDILAPVVEEVLKKLDIK